MQCPHCLLVLEDVPEYGGTLVACPHCAGRFVAPACAVKAIPSRFRQTRRKRGISAIAAILSFFVPGLGQMCQGRAEAGICFFLGCGVLAIAAAVLWPLALLAVPLWLWNVVDAAQH